MKQHNNHQRRVSWNYLYRFHHRLWLWRVRVCVPGSLGDGTPLISTPVAGVGDFEQVLVVFKNFTRSTEAKKHFVIVDEPLTHTDTNNTRIKRTSYNHSHYITSCVRSGCWEEMWHSAGSRLTVTVIFFFSSCWMKALCLWAFWFMSSSTLWATST